jgi:hypothetical protein
MPLRAGGSDSPGTVSYLFRATITVAASGLPGLSDFPSGLPGFHRGGKDPVEQQIFSQGLSSYGHTSAVASSTFMSAKPLIRKTGESGEKLETLETLSRFGGYAESAHYPP